LVFYEKARIFLAMLDKNREKNKEAADEEDRVVRLKPLFSIKPGVYLTALYAAVIFIIIFLIFFAPSLKAGGTIYHFTSEPSGAAVRVDGVYMGASPCDVVVKKGEREITFIAPGFNSASQKAASGFSPLAGGPLQRKIKIHAVLTQTTPLSALTEGARDYASWSFAADGSGLYQTPLSLSLGAKRSAAYFKADSGVKNEAGALLLASARFINSAHGLKDFILAKMYLETGGKALTPPVLTEAVLNIALALQKEPLLTVALAEFLPEQYAGIILESGLYPREIIDFTGENKHLSDEKAVFGSVLTVSGVNFIEVKGGSFTQSAAFPRVLNMEPFYIAETEISAASYAAFTAENSEWSAENTASLIEKGLVTEDYLLSSKDYAGSSVCGISAYAAEAYCAWLSLKLPAALARDYEVRPPSEAEWEYAAKSSGPLSVRRLKNMTHSPEEEGGAGLWEWCSDGFAAQNYISAPKEALDKIPSPQRNVRGGAWVNPPLSVNAETRASLPPSSCSPFVSARPVIVKKER
jgi:hypothetical protein